MALNNKRLQPGYPKEIAAEVYEMKKRATDLFHSDHDDGDTAIYGLLAELAPVITAYKDKAVEEARADEIQRICDEVGLFTKPRNKAVYNVYLPIEYLIKRVAIIKKNRLKGEK